MTAENNCWEEAYNCISRGRPEEAEKLCRQLPCSERSIECQRYLGWNEYESGDMEKALFWFKKAAEKNDGESFYGIGSIYLAQGNFQLALLNYKKSLSFDYGRSSCWLGYMYESGLGTEKDIETAKNYYRIGSDYGYLIAKRASIRIAFDTGTVFQKIMSMASMINVAVKTFFIAKKDVNDERLAEIPNVFKNK